MAEDNNDDNEVSVHAWGKSVSIKGVGTIFIVIVVVFAAGLGWMLYDLSHATSRSVNDALIIQGQTAVEHKAIMDVLIMMKENQSVVINGVKDVKESVEIQNYILLEDQRGRDRIKNKIRMPNKLREILNER